MSPRLIVITGPMFSRKSGELINLLERHRYAKKKVLALKPTSDSRQTKIISRRITSDGSSQAASEIEAFPISSLAELEQLLERHQPDVLAIDEAQFFEAWLVEAIRSLVRTRAKNLSVIYIAGLDQDAWGKPFGYMGDFMVLANEVHKLTAVCFQCGNENANLSYKQSRGSGQVEVGDVETYEARCPACWQEPEDHN